MYSLSIYGGALIYIYLIMTMRLWRMWVQYQPVLLKHIVLLHIIIICVRKIDRQTDRHRQTDTSIYLWLIDRQTNRKTSFKFRLNHCQRLSTNHGSCAVYYLSEQCPPVANIVYRKKFAKHATRLKSHKTLFRKFVSLKCQFWMSN